MTRSIQPPSGTPPPERAVLADGTSVALRPIAEEITERHLRRHPEDLERYGEVVRAWGVHDAQHLLEWAALESTGHLQMSSQVAWLARVLHARGYPLANFVSCLELSAEVVEEFLTGAPGRDLGERLRAAVDAARSAVPV